MIYGLDGQRTESNSFAGRLNVPFTASRKIECRTGYKLRCFPVANLTVESRKSGDVSWIDIETTPIDLSADDGNLITYEFRFTGTALGISNAAVYVGV